MKCNTCDNSAKTFLQDNEPIECWSCTIKRTRKEEKEFKQEFDSLFKAYEDRIDQWVNRLKGV